MKKQIAVLIARILKEWDSHKAWIVIAGLIVIFFIYYARWKSTTPPQYIKVPEIKEVVKYKIKKVEVPVEKITVLEKEKIVKHVKNLMDTCWDNWSGFDRRDY